MTILENVLTKREMTFADLECEREDVLNWDKMKKTADLFGLNILVQRKVTNIGVLYDPDVDGAFSGYIVEDFLSRAGISKRNIYRMMNKNKVHGYSKAVKDWVLSNNIELLIIPDAGSSNALEIHTELPDLHCLILDHHEYTPADLPTDTKVTVLNVSDDENLPALSGCGVAFRFIEMVGRKFGIETDLYMPYVGITVLSDLCSMKDKENRFYVSKAYDNYHVNKFLEAFPFYGSYKTFFNFQVSPYLNALIRCGEEDKMMNIVNSMDDPIVTSGIRSDIARVKGEQQNRMSDMFNMGQLKELKGCVVHIRHEGKEHKSLNGLLANKLLSVHSCSALVLRLNKEKRVWEGSFRGKFSNTILKEWGFDARGHDKACGITVEHEKLLDFINRFEYVAGATPKTPDAVLDAHDFTVEEALDIARFNEYASSDIEPIYVEFTNKAEEYNIIPSNKRVYLKVADIQIVDFAVEPVTDNVLAEPALQNDVLGFQLARRY